MVFHIKIRAQVHQQIEVQELKMTLRIGIYLNFVIICIITLEISKNLDLDIKRYESENEFEYANIIHSQLNELKKIENDKLYSQIIERHSKEVKIYFIKENSS